MLIDFWTYTCINCIRTLPYLRAWDAEYRDDGLTIVGVHAPEFAFEKDAGNVDDAIERLRDLEYPVVQDNELGTWDAFANQYWPAKYLIDADGEVRYVHFGEGDYETTEAAIRSLLAEAGDARLGGGASAEAETRRPGAAHPRDLPRLRARRRASSTAAAARDARLRRRRIAAALRPNEFAYGGDWRIDPESAHGGAGEAELDASLPGAARLPACWAPRTGPARSRSCSTASRSPTPRAGEDVRGGRRDGRRTSASTGSSTCRRPGATRSTLASSPGSPATRSRSASATARCAATVAMRAAWRRTSCSAAAERAAGFGEGIAAAALERRAERLGVVRVDEHPGLRRRRTPAGRRPSSRPRLRSIAIPSSVAWPNGSISDGWQRTSQAAIQRGTSACGMRPLSAHVRRGPRARRAAARRRRRRAGRGRAARTRRRARTTFLRSISEPTHRNAGPVAVPAELARAPARRAAGANASRSTPQSAISSFAARRGIRSASRSASQRELAITPAERVRRPSRWSPRRRRGRGRGWRRPGRAP